MAEYQKSDYEEASSIVKSLVEKPDVPRDPMITIEIRKGLSIADIQSDADDFEEDAGYLNAKGRWFPAMRAADKRKLPISLHVFYGAPRNTPRHLYEDLAHLPERKITHGIAELTFLEVDEARQSFIANATEALAYRIATVREYYSASRTSSGADGSLRLPTLVGGSRTSIPGCKFSVSTDSPGLRVIWSGAYYITKNNFGSPTSPALGVLQSGSYVFGVDGGAYGSVVQWDDVVCPLPGTPNFHLNY